MSAPDAQASEGAVGEVANPPAFPCETDGNPNGFQSGVMLWTYPGMTLRDWFAGQALAGFTSCCMDDGDAVMGAADTAKAAYNYADAMLRARLPAAAVAAVEGEG